MPIFFTDHFKTRLKKLKNKHPTLKEDFLASLETFDPQKEISIGKSIYKIRISSSDMKKGKSGGFRAYLYLYIKKDLLVPIYIYPKSETESITQNELKYHFDQTIKEVLSQL